MTTQPESDPGKEAEERHHCKSTRLTETGLDA